MTNQRSIYPSEILPPSDKSVAEWSPQNSVNIDKKPLPLKLTKHLRIFTAAHILNKIHAFYRKWAYFVDKFAIPIIVLSLILTGIGTFKTLTTQRKNDITNYTPYGVRSRQELAIRQEFFNENGAYIYFVLLAKPLHDHNMINVDYLRELVEVDDLIRNNFTIRNHYTGQLQSYSQFCKRLCDINEPLRMFYFGLSLQEEKKSNGEPFDETIKLNYPITEILGRKINIQLNFFGITFKNDTEGSYTNIESAETASLFYQAERVGGWTDDEVKEYEMAMNNYFRKNYTSKNLKIMTASRKFVEVEFIRSGMKLVPLLGIGFVIMSIVASITVLISAFYMKQASFSKVILAFTASVCPFMASGTAIGILLYCGVRFGSILLLAPFLLLVIGLDDSYLMIHSWQRLTEKRRLQPPKIGDSAAERLAEVLIETGPSIMISALTNILADAIGAFTGSPEITLLCMGTMLSVLIDFFYQITVFCAVMILLGKREMEQEQSLRDTPEHSIEGSSSQEDEKSFHKKFNEKFGSFVESYVKFITNAFVSTIVVILWICFLAFSAWMMSRLQVNLTTEKLYAEDSPLREIDWYKEHVMLPTFENAYIFVNNPGNLSDHHRLERLNHMVHELESQPESYGPNTTRYFVRDFIEYEKENKEAEMNADIPFEADVNDTTSLQAVRTIDDREVSVDEMDIPDFVDWDESLNGKSQWKPFLKYHEENNKTELDSFFFTTAYHGESLKVWYQKAQLLKRLRGIIDKYSDDFNASIYFDQGIFLDLVDNLPTDLWQSLLGTVIAMSVVCFIFMNNFLTAFVTTGMIASIVISVLGILKLLGVTMDPIMMTGVIISVGFSVDIPAHVSYHFHTAGKHQSEKLNVEDKIKHSLASVGYPAIQGALSTACCVVSLLTIKLYLANMFFKCISLTLLLCVIHSLVILPAMFSFFDRLLVLLKLRKRADIRAREDTTTTEVNAG